MRAMFATLVSSIFVLTAGSGWAVQYFGDEETAALMR